VAEFSNESEPKNDIQSAIANQQKYAALAKIMDEVIPCGRGPVAPQVTPPGPGSAPRRDFKYAGLWPGGYPPAEQESPREGRTGFSVAFSTEADCHDRQHQQVAPGSGLKPVKLDFGNSSVEFSQRKPEERLRVTFTQKLSI
jgi:hypothetical protein